MYPSRQKTIYGTTIHDDHCKVTTVGTHLGGFFCKYFYFINEKLVDSCPALQNLTIRFKTN
jgi:hypothetical protein